MYSYRNVFRGCHRIDWIILYANAEACAECISILTYGYIIDIAEKKWSFCMLHPAEVQSSMKEFCWSLLCLRISFASLHCIKNEKVYLQNDWRLVAPMQNEPVVSDLLVDTGNPTFCLSAPSSFSLPHSVPAMLFQEIKTVAWHIQPPCTCREIHLI